jgi:uncharacterized membrane protein YfhO
VVVASGEPASLLLADSNFDPFAAVILPSPVQAVPGGEDEVQVTQDGSGDVRLSVDAAAPGVLVLSEAYLPGWAVTVDGRPGEVLRADEALLAVALPSGRHEVAFAYRPPALRWGAGLSLAGLVLALVLLSARSLTLRSN